MTQTEPKEKKITETERMISIVTDLQKAHPDVITDSFIKKALKNTSLTRSFPSKWGGKAKVREEGKPRGPRNAYILFNTEFRNKNKDQLEKMSNKEIVKEFAKVWQKMSKEEKHVYEEYAAKDKERFVQEMKAYDPSYTEKSEQPKRPKNGYQLFLEENKEQILKENPDVDPKGRQALFTTRWAAMSESEKAVYSDKAKKLKAESVDASAAVAAPVAQQAVVEKPKKAKKSAEKVVEAASVPVEAPAPVETPTELKKVKKVKKVKTEE